MKKPARKFTRRFGIQAQVFALALLVTVCTGGVIIFTSASTFSAQLRRSTIQSAEFGLQATAASIRQGIQEVDELSRWCSIDATVRTAMLTDISTGVLTHTVYPLISNKYYSLHTAPYIQRLLLASDNGRVIMLGTAASQSARIDQSSVGLLPSLDEDGLPTRWAQIIQDPLIQAGISMESIPVVHTMVRGPSQHEALVYLGVSPALIAGPMQDYAFEDGSWLCWIMGGVAYRAEGSRLVPLEAAETLLANPADSRDTLDAGTMVYSAQIEGASYSVVVCPLGIHDLYLGQAIPASRMQTPWYLLRGPALTSLLVVAALGAVMALLLHRIVAVPIRQLGRRIDWISQGDFTVDPSIEWNHELGDVGREINHLAQSVSELMLQRVEDEQQRLSLEYRMLQNQISPHFIHNTLNSIKWMATIQHAPGVAEMVTALSRLLKNVSKGNQRLVPLTEEFNLLEDYFTIQRYRYGGTITLEMPGKEELAALDAYRIPRFSLQPLAENAIFHGIEPKGGVGRLCVGLEWGQGSDLVIRLADDGIGMTQEQIDRVLAGPDRAEAQQQPFRQVGVWNVHRLLQLSFGPEYGLAIESGPQGGTVVRLRVPRAADPAGSDPREEDPPVKSGEGGKQDA